MAVHFVFGCSTQSFSLPVTEHSIPLGKLKDEIYNLKFRKGCEKRPVKEAFDFRIFYAETKEEIVGAQSAIARHSRLVVKRMPVFALKALREKEQLAARSSRKVEEVDEPYKLTEEDLDDGFGDDVYSTSSREGSSSGISATISSLTEIPPAITSLEVEKRGAASESTVVERTVVPSRRAMQVAKNSNVDLESLIKSSPQATFPLELMCSLCHEIMHDPVLIPCCYISFCRKCIVTTILEQHKCPACGSSKSKDSNLLPNRNTNDRIVSYLKSSGSASHVAAVSSKGSCSSQPLVPIISSETGRGRSESNKKTLNYNKPPVVPHLASQEAPWTNVGGKRKAPQYITQSWAKRNQIKFTTN